MSASITVRFSNEWRGFLEWFHRPDMLARVCPDGPVQPVNPQPEDKLIEVLANDARAGFFYLRAKAGSLYEVHTLLAVKGADALVAGRAGMDKMFLESDCTALFSWCPDSIPEALVFSLRCGMRRAGRRADFWTKAGAREGAEVVHLTLLDWLNATRQQHAAAGEQFHAALFEHVAEHHADDPVHDATVGTFLTMARHQPHKALSFYNYWAVLFGFKPVALLAVTDGSVIWDNRDAVVALNRTTGQITIIERKTLCQ